MEREQTDRTDEAAREASSDRADAGMAHPRLATWWPHYSKYAARSFSGAIFQLVGGRRWSLCLVTKITSPDKVGGPARSSYLPPPTRRMAGEASS